MLFRYDQIVPGAAERIIKLAEGQSAHRQSLEVKAIDHEIKSSTFGQRGALVIAVLGIGAGSFAIYRGANLAGSVIAGSTISAIAVAYLTGAFTRSQERKTKARMMAGETTDDQAPKLPSGTGSM